MKDFLHNHGIPTASLAVTFMLLGHSLVAEAKTELGESFNYNADQLSSHFMSKLFNPTDCHDFFINTQIKQQSPSTLENQDLFAKCGQSISPFASPKGYL